MNIAARPVNRFRAIVSLDGDRSVPDQVARVLALL